MKKYEKYIRKENASNRKSSNDNNLRIHSDVNIEDPGIQASKHSGIQPQFHTTNEKISKEIKRSNDNTKHIYYEKLWPKTNNIRKKSVRTTNSPENAHLTALASFPVSTQKLVN